MRANLSHYLGRLWRFGVILSLDDHIAEKLVEQTCICALELEPVLFCTKRMDCWLFSMLHSFWFNGHRSRRYRPGQLNANHRVRAATRDCGSHERDGAELVLQVMELPNAYRATLFLAYVEGMSYREVAEVLALPVDAVTNALATARILLAESTIRSEGTVPGEVV